MFIHFIASLLMGWSVAFSPALQAPIALTPAAATVTLLGDGLPPVGNSTVQPPVATLAAIGAAVRLAISPVKPAAGTMSLAGAATGLIVGPGIPGFLAPGHFLPSIQPMVLVHPRPDSETSPNARHHWVFSDGSNTFLYDVPIDLVGGAWPHVPVLMGGPPGMTILMPNYAAGPPYPSPRVQWLPPLSTPIGSQWTVWVRWYSQEYPTDKTQFIDQQWLLTLSSDISHGGVFVFASKDNGLSGNPGSWAAPVDDLPTVFGTSWAAAPVVGTPPIATGGKICVAMESAAAYTWPLFTDGGSTQPHFQVQVQTKPIALIGIPGQTPPKFSVAGAGGAGLTTDTKTGDWFMSGLNPDGYNTFAENFQLSSVGGSGDNRITFDKITWSNSGWGNVTQITATSSGTTLTVLSVQSGAPIVPGMTIGLAVNTTIPTIAGLGTGTGGPGTYTLSAAFATDHTTPTTFYLFFGRGNCVAFEAVAFNGSRKYIYVNDCTETNRQPGNPGNNGAGVDWFSCQYSLVQGWHFNQSDWVGDGGSFLKIDNPNCEIRGCVMLCSFVIQAFSFAYYSAADGSNFSLSDSKHNILVTTSLGGGGYVGVPINATPGYGTLRLGRCNLSSATTSGGVRSAPNTGGPYYVTNNAVQTPNTTTPPPGTVAAGNVVQASGLLLPDGSLDPSNPNYLLNNGVIGARVA